VVFFLAESFAGICIFGHKKRELAALSGILFMVEKGALGVWILKPQFVFPPYLYLLWRNFFISLPGIVESFMRNEKREGAKVQ